MTMALLGLIVGFGVATFMKGGIVTSAQIPSQQVAQVPSAQPIPQQAPAPKPAPGPLPPVDFKTDHIRGNPKATVAVIEYSDFECPFCIRLEPTLAQISKEYGDKVMIVYRHFPLGFHANAPKEAEATECANELGGNDAFWSYHDEIFKRTTGNGTGFPLDNLIPLAKELGLNETAFKSCLDSGKYAKHVADEMAAGQAAGVSGTPGNFVVNLKTQKNQMISGAQPFANFKQAIDAMLNDTAAAAPSNTAVRVIKMTAELWKFTPNMVTVKQGEKVALEVTGVSGTHGLAIPELGINETIIQGKTVTIAVPTDKTGTFDFRCSIQCGSGHSDMTGKIVIEG